MSNSKFCFRNGKYFKVEYVGTGECVPSGMPMGEAVDDHIELTERVDKEIPTKEVIEALENWL